MEKDLAFVLFTCDREKELYFTLSSVLSVKPTKLYLVDNSRKTDGFFSYEYSNYMVKALENEGWKFEYVDLRGLEYPLYFPRGLVAVQEEYVYWLDDDVILPNPEIPYIFYNLAKKYELGFVCGGVLSGQYWLSPSELSFWSSVKFYPNSNMLFNLHLLRKDWDSFFKDVIEIPSKYFSFFVSYRLYSYGFLYLPFLYRYTLPTQSIVYFPVSSFDYGAKHIEDVYRDLKSEGKYCLYSYAESQRDLNFDEDMLRDRQRV